MKTLEKYLKDNLSNNTIDFALRARQLQSGAVVVYIHPDGKDGETMDFAVEGNTLINPQGGSNG